MLDAAVLLRPGRSPNAFEETVQRLLQSLRLGLISPGAKLPAERDLAAMLRVSRDTLREAISALADAGYLVARRGRYGGTFVAEELPDPTPVMDQDGDLAPRSLIPRAEMEDAFTLRRILEVGAAREVATNGISSADHTRLRAARTACKEADEHSFRRLDARLHLLIGELVRAPSLLPLIADVRMRINELLDRIPLLPPNLDHSDAQHAEIIEALAKGDPRRAAQAMQEHLEGTEALIRGFLA